MNIEMEEKESTISGSSSPENTDSGSPTPISSSAAAASLMTTPVGPTTNNNNNHHQQQQGVPPPPPTQQPFPPGGVPLSLSATNSGKKKRGRPRKYDENGNLNPAYAAKLASNKLAAAAAAAAGGAGVAVSVAPPPGFTLTVSPPPPGGSGGGEFVVGPKRGRGRGRGSAHHHQHGTPPAVSGALSSQPQHWQQQHLSPLPLGEVFAHTAGGDFTPYVITVQTGEDVANTIFSFSQKGPRGICILSANGAVSSVTIRQPGSSSLLTYEGRFEILSLTGSYTVSEADGVKSRSGGLSISLASSDGRVIGGSVAGWLTAASPIQVVLGSFVPNLPMGGFKEQKRKYVRQTPPAAAAPAIPETVASASPARHGMPESGACPPAMSFMQAQSHSTEADDSTGSGHNLNNMVSSHNNTPEWNNGTEPSADHRIYPDINVSVVPGIQ